MVSSKGEKGMETVDKVSRVLGVALYLQFVTSFSSGVFLQPALIVPGNR